jgi:hypothetical protein
MLDVAAQGGGDVAFEPDRHRSEGRMANGALQQPPEARQVDEIARLAVRWAPRMAQAASNAAASSPGKAAA